MTEPAKPIAFDDLVRITGKASAHQPIWLDTVLGNPLYWIVSRTIDVDHDEIQLRVWSDEKYQRVFHPSVEDE